MVLASVRIRPATRTGGLAASRESWSAAACFSTNSAGVAVHSGSACSSESIEPSPVLEAMGADASHSLRLSVGWTTTEADCAAFAEAFPRVVADLRALRN